MMFVDGENLTIRAQKVAAQGNVPLTEGPHFRRDVFFWLPGILATQRLTSGGQVALQPQAVRSFYYTSAVGDDVLLQDVRERLWDIGFTPQVFKRGPGDRRAKAVDISLARDMLSNAFLGNFEAAVLVAGDGDYVPIVQEVQRLGKVVYVLFLRAEGLSNELRLASDLTFVLDELIAAKWQNKPSSESAVRLVRTVTAST